MKTFYILNFNLFYITLQENSVLELRTETNATNVPRRLQRILAGSQLVLYFIDC